MKFKFSFLTVSLAVMSMTSTMAQTISNDLIRIGHITDMSGVYSDIDGPPGTEAIKKAIAGGDVINSIKTACEFGVTPGMKPADLLVFINDPESESTCKL